jgi:hypothetical protein
LLIHAVQLHTGNTACLNVLCEEDSRDVKLFATLCHVQQIGFGGLRLMTVQDALQARITLNAIDKALIKPLVSVKKAPASRKVWKSQDTRATRTLPHIPKPYPLDSAGEPIYAESTSADIFPLFPQLWLMRGVQVCLKRGFISTLDRVQLGLKEKPHCTHIQSLDLAHGQSHRVKIRTMELGCYALLESALLAHDVYQVRRSTLYHSAFQCLPAQLCVGNTACLNILCREDAPDVALFAKLCHVQKRLARSVQILTVKEALWSLATFKAALGPVEVQKRQISRKPGTDVHVPAISFWFEHQNDGRVVKRWQHPQAHVPETAPLARRLIEALERDKLPSTDALNIAQELGYRYVNIGRIQREGRQTFLPLPHSFVDWLWVCLDLDIEGSSASVAIPGIDFFLNTERFIWHVDRNYG